MLKSAYPHIFTCKLACAIVVEVYVIVKDTIFCQQKN